MAGFSGDIWSLVNGVPTLRGTVSNIPYGEDEYREILASAGFISPDLVPSFAPQAGSVLGPIVGGLAGAAAGAIMERIMPQTPGPSLPTRMPGGGPPAQTVRVNPINPLKGYYNKQGRWIPRKRPSMNVLNPRALRRAMRRVEGFASFAKRTITFTKKVRMKKKGKR